MRMRTIFDFQKKTSKYNLSCRQFMRNHKLKRISKKSILFLILKILRYLFNRKNSSSNFSKQTSFRLESILKSSSYCHQNRKRNQNFNLLSFTPFITHPRKDLFMSRTLNSLRSKVMFLITSQTVHKPKEIYLPLPIDLRTYR